MDAPAESTACEAKLLDATGNTVAEAKYTIDDPAQIGDFKPKASGKHYLRATCDLVEDSGTSYEVLVTAR